MYLYLVDAQLDVKSSRRHCAKRCAEALRGSTASTSTGVESIHSVGELVMELRMDRQMSAL